MNLLLRYIAPKKKIMLIGLGIKIFGTLIELFLPYILSYILDEVIVTKQVGRVIFMGAIMIACAALALVCNVKANRMAAKVSADISGKIRQDLFEKTLSLSARDTDRYTIPSLESRITSDTYNVHNFLSVMQRMGVRAPMLLVGGITITMIMDLRLSLVMVAMLPPIFLIIYFISKKGVPLYTDVQKSVDGMVRVVREDVQGIRVIKALSKNEYENSRYDRVNLNLSKKERRAGVIMGSVNPMMVLLMNLGITAVVAISAFLISRGVSSATTVIAFMQYFTLISMAMMTLSRIFVMYTKCSASAVRIDEVLATPDTFEVKDNTEKDDTGAYISFKNVSFSYFGRRNDLDGVDFSIKRGESLGIIGATGSGKSTLIKLLMRFYDTTSGHIYIDGRDVSSYEREELASLFGVVMQNDFLFADTIAENIRFGRDLSQEAVERAAKIAQAHDFIVAKGGYDYRLSQKGTNLSGGQRQRLLISRAVAAVPAILILDDSSSALDYKTDAALRKALRESLSDSTVITVAQRVSSVKDSDLILVIDEGKIIGKGTHEELLLKCPEYKEISDSQMGGAFVE